MFGTDRPVSDLIQGARRPIGNTYRRSNVQTLNPSTPRHNRPQGGRVIIIAIVSDKGGVGKPTTAIHFSAILHQKAPCLLIDGDANRSAIAWSKRGELPFRVVDKEAAARYTRDFEHIVIDTAAHPSRRDIEAMIEGCDYIIIICEPETMSLDVLPGMLEDLSRLKSEKHRVLLCQVSPLSMALDARLFIEQLNVKTLKRHIQSHRAFKLAAMQGVTVKEVADPYAAPGWYDLLKDWLEM